MSGAVDFNECIRDSWERCQCGRCMRCGFPKHSGVHGPVNFEPPGSRPWGHEYVPREALIEVATGLERSAGPLDNVEAK
jgi:hypothetical protein